MIPFVINMVNSSHNLPMILPMKFILSVIPLIKTTRYIFFALFKFIFFTITFSVNIKGIFMSAKLSAIYQ